MSQPVSPEARQSSKSLLWMAAALAAVALACGGVGWALRADDPMVCFTKSNVQSCHTLGHPFAPLGAVTLAVAGVGLAIALLWVVVALTRR